MPEPVRFGAIEISADGVAEMGGGRRVVFVPRTSVRAIAVGRGFTVERPIPTFLAGAATLVAGTYLVLQVAGPLVRGGTANLTYFEDRLAFVIGGVLLAVIGVRLAWILLRRSTYLRVATETEQRKLIVHAAIDPAGLRESLRQAEARFGYAVDWSALAD
jgi:hypothetical protein